MRTTLFFFCCGLMGSTILRGQELRKVNRTVLEQRKPQFTVTMPGRRHTGHKADPNNKREVRGIPLDSCISSRKIPAELPFSTLEDDSDEQDTLKEPEHRYPAVGIAYGIQNDLIRSSGRSKVKSGASWLISLEIPLDLERTWAIEYVFHRWKGTDTPTGDKLSGWGTTLTAKFYFTGVDNLVRPSIHFGFASPQEVFPLTLLEWDVGASIKFSINRNISGAISVRQLLTNFPAGIQPYSGHYFPTLTLLHVRYQF